MARKTLDELLLGKPMPSEGETSDRPVTTSPARSISRFPSALVIAGVAVLVVLALLLYVVYDLKAAVRDLRAELDRRNKDIELAFKRLDDADNRYANLKAQLEVTSQHIGITERELDRARLLAAQIKREQEQKVQELMAELARKAEAAQVAALQEEHNKKIGALAGDITTVKGDVITTREEVEKTKQELSGVQLKLSEYGTLIARNREELAELRRRGERDYFEFDISKKSGFQQVADIRIAVSKTDVKKKKFNVVLYVGDFKVEKKDRTINEPIQFRAEKGTAPYELVVNDVQKDRIIGYLAVPKDRAANLKPAITR
ncbi:MAG TPA: hypothetical protein VNM72_00750 [Blastocatellia bacterium]|nr:hypothetical protein [Blastocatellia bacterium]